MSKTENITCDDVKDIIRLACPYYEKKSALHNYDSFMLVENPLCNLLLSKSAFPAPQDLPEIETERGFLRPLEETGKDFLFAISTPCCSERPCLMLWIVLLTARNTHAVTSAP